MVLYKVRPRESYEVPQTTESPFIVPYRSYRKYIGVDEDGYPIGFDLINTTLEVGCTISLRHTSSFWDKLRSNSMGTIKIKGKSEVIDYYEVLDTPPPDVLDGQDVFPEIPAV